MTIERNADPTPSRPTLPFGVILALAVCLFSNLLATTSDWLLGQQPRADPHDIAFYEDVAKRLLPAVPPFRTIGYITNAPPEHFYKFQYALVPLLLTSAPSESVVLGYFPSTPAETVTKIAATHGTYVKTSLGRGVYVMMR